MDEVTGLKAVPVPEGVKLEWGVTSTSYLDGFEIIVTAGGVTVQRVEVGMAERSCTVTGLNPTVEYKFNVRCVVEQGGKSVEASPAPPAPEGPLLRLTADRSGVVLAALPVGAAAGKFAQMKDLAGTGVVYGPLRVPVGGGVTPGPGTPVVDAVGVDASGKEVGVWYSSLPSNSRIVTTPKVAPGVLQLGVDIGGWGGVFTDLPAGCGFRAAGSAAKQIEEAAPHGVHCLIVIFGTGGSLSGLATLAYRSTIETFLLKYGKGGSFWVGKTDLGVENIEVTHEPGGSWFWSDSTDYTAYVDLLVLAHEAAHNVSQKLGMPPARILASIDGGQGGIIAFGEGIMKAGASPYFDWGTVHPYGGANGGNGGAAGDRRKLELALALVGRPVVPTEMGWSTATGQPSTGDSQQWTPMQQAANIMSWVAFCTNLGVAKVPLTVNFNFVDYGTNAFYGLETSSRAHKPAFAAYASASTVAADRVERMSFEPVEATYVEGGEEHVWRSGQKYQHSDHIFVTK